METQVRNDKLNKYMKNCVIGISIFLMAFVFSLQSSMNIWQIDISATDSSVFQYVARVILNGGMPYVDAFDHKGPLIYLINAAGILISQWRGIWLIELTVLFATFIIIYRIARLKCNRILSMLTLLCVSVMLFSYYEGGNLTEEYAMPCIAVAAYIFADYFLNNKINRFRLILCGFSFGAVCLLRINMAVVWAVMCIAVLIQCLKEHQYMKLGYFLAYFILGTMFITAPILIWLAVNGAFTAFIENYFLFNLEYSSYQDVANYANRISSILRFLDNEFVAVAFGFSVYSAIKKKDIFHAFYVLFIAGSLFVIGMAGRAYPHYGMILLPAMAYPFACLADMIKNEVKVHQGTALLFILLVLSNHVFPVWYSAVNNAAALSYEHTEPYLDHTATKTRDIIRYYTEEDDQIIVPGNWNVIYNLSDRFAASKYSYQMPIASISSEIRDEFFSDIKRNMPKAIVLLKGSYAYQEMLDFIEQYNYQWIWQSDDAHVDVFLRECE